MTTLFDAPLADPANNWWRRAGGWPARFARGLTIGVMGVGLGLAAFGQSNVEGYLHGKLPASAPRDAIILIENEETGLTRELAPETDGAFRSAPLPPGRYQVSLRGGGRELASQDVRVRVGLGSPVRLIVSGAEALLMDPVLVGGATVAPIDVSQTAAVTVLHEQMIDQLPVARTLQSVAMLAPGATLGDSAFEGLTSFGGASVAENAYFINGFNVTNFRNGLGGGTVPFEFFSEFQINTGGYSAEFGRSAGGVVNTVTKRGGNTWRSSLSVFHEPHAWAAQAPTVFLPDGTVVLDNRRDQAGSTTVNMSIGGPLIPNRVFIYALYNGRRIEGTSAKGAQLLEKSSRDPFWGLKLDWRINARHWLEYTAFSDQQRSEERQYAYDSATEVQGEYLGSSFIHRGGRNHSLRYTGTLTDAFTLSALYGRGEASYTDAGAGDAFPYIFDQRVVPNVILGRSTSILPGTSEDEREAYRADGEYRLGRHRLRFGVDREDNHSSDKDQYSGGQNWRLNLVPSSGVVNTVAVPPGTTEYTRFRVYENGGSFEVETTAFYLEDTVKLWDDRLLLTAGVRRESFDNKDANGDTFARIEGEWAPRIAMAWDVQRDGRTKLFANFGRYHLPMAANINIRMGGAEIFYEEFYVMEGLDENSVPITGAQLGPRNTFSNGTIRDPRTTVNQQLEPMYQDEFIVGYQRAVGPNWSVGVRGVYRDLGSALEDIAIDRALNTYAEERGYDELYGYEAAGFDHYVLTNPGKDMTIHVDFDADPSTAPERVELTAAELGYPESTRRYYAAELFAERVWNGRWSANFSYTWSRNYGNHEGYVRSDTGQGDAALTSFFDQPGLMEHGHGYLPNDRRHTFKAFGLYQLSDTLQIGANLLIQSGRPINAFGVHPTDAFAATYGAMSHFAGGQPVPRGSKGRTPWTHSLALSLRYRPEWGDQKLGFGIDVFNVLNEKRTSEVDEVFELNDGTPRLQYGSPTEFQMPRYVRLSATVDF